ncbi:hypothetical protein BGZ75_005554 [Mortierella antarctica]|nr:hypothetical protein BGZ75_005554 [Mortierella antarctica]
MALEVPLGDFKCLEDGYDDYKAANRTRYREEQVESLRFPLAIDPTRRRTILIRVGTTNLRTLNMSYGNYLVRVKDGLELVLPGLQQNLTSWKVDMESGYPMGTSEVEFFGKHFGYGQDFSVEKDDGQDQLEGKTRKAQLERLVLDTEAVRHVRREVKDWASRQGFDLELGYRGW